MTLIFEGLALNALRNGDEMRAAKVPGAAHRIKQDTGVAITEVSVNSYEELDTLLEKDHEPIQAAYSEGTALTLDEAIDLARA